MRLLILFSAIVSSLFFSSYILAIQPSKISVQKFHISHITLVPCPKKIIIIRHAEKPPNTNIKHLTAIGWTRAHLLPRIFKADFIGVGKNISNRSVETCMPMAKTVSTKHYYAGTIGQEKAMVKSILSNPLINNGVVFICWEYKHLPDLVNAFGGNLNIWPKNDFDTVITLNFELMGNACTYKKQIISKEGLIPILQKYIKLTTNGYRWTGPSNYSPLGTPNNYNGLLCENPSNPRKPNC